MCQAVFEALVIGLSVCVRGVNTDVMHEPVIAHIRCHLPGGDLRGNAGCGRAGASCSLS